MKTLNELETEFAAIKEKYDLLMSNPSPTQTEISNVMSLGAKMKELASEIQEMKSGALTSKAKNLGKLSSWEKPLDELKNELHNYFENDYPNFQKEFYPNLLQNPLVFEKHLTEAKIKLNGLKQNGFNGITALIDDIRESLDFKRIDFVTLMINGIDDFFNKSIATARDGKTVTEGEAYINFQKLKYRFYKNNNRQEAMMKYKDAVRASEILADFEYEQILESKKIHLG